MLILKQINPANVASPPIGKTTLFANNTGGWALKDSNGSVSTFVTGENPQFTGNANVTGNLGVSGTIYGNISGNITGNIVVPGSNTQVLINNDGNIGASTNLTFNGTVLSVTGNITSSNIYANSGTIGASLLTGTLTTASQPNITSVGTLSSLNVTASTVSGNVYANSGTVRGNLLTGTITTNAQPNITSVGTLTSLDVTANVTAGNIYANTGTIGAILINGTLTTSAQPNITSVGTLSSLAVSANITTGGIKTDNIYYANGTPWDMQQPAGSNTQIQYNLNSDFGASANFTFNASTNTLVVNGASNLTTVNSNVVNANVGNLGNLNVTGYVTSNLIPNANVTYNLGNNTNRWNNLYLAGNTIYLGDTTLSAGTGDTFTVANLAVNVNATFGNAYANSGTIGASLLTGTLTTSSQPNITSVGTLTDLSVSGNALISGNLTVDGTLVYINVSDLSVEDPIIQLQSGPNGAAPISNSGKDVGTALNYYNSSAKVAFMGWDVSNAEIAFGSDVTITNDVVAFNSLANIRSGNAQLGNTATANYFTGVLTTSSQPNITSVGTLNSLAVSANVTSGNVYANSGTIGASLLTGTLTTSSQPNITSVGTLSSLGVSGGVTASTLTSNVATGTAPLTVTSTTKVANLNADLLDGYSTSTSNTADTVAVRDTNGNLSATYFIGNGSQLTGIDATSIQNGNSNVKVAANGNVSISVTGNSNIVVVTDTGVNVAGYLTSTANITAPYFIGNVQGNISGNIVVPGTNTSVLFNNDGNAGASDGFKFNKDTNAVVITGNLTSANANLGNTATANYFTGVLTTASQPNITSVGTLSSLAVSGNITSGNVYANSGTIGASLLTGTLTTAAQPNITSVGTLSSLNVSGNANVGNLGTAQVLATANITTPQFISNIATGTAPLVVSSTTKVANLNADLLDGYTSATAATGDTIVLRDTNGNITANNITGTLTTATQTNITSVGTLSALTVSGNVTSGNVYANSGTIGASLLTGTLTTAAQPNITSVGTLSSLSVSGNVTSGNVYANSGTIGASLLTGTLTTASQPNITSVGTLSSLSVTGTATAGNLSTGGTLGVTGNANVGNIGAATGVFTANVSANNMSTTNKLTVGNALVVTTGGANITGDISVTGNFNVTGNLNYSNVTDLVVGDPLIYMGANNTGNLYDLGIVASYNDGTYYHTGLARNHNNGYWTFFDGVVQEPTTVIDWANAVYPTVKMGNLLTTGTANITGNANVGNIGATNAVFTGTANVTGNANVGNLGTAQVLASANITTPQFISNVSTGTAPLVVSSTTKVANLNADLLDGYNSATAATGDTIVLRDTNGNITGNNISGTLTTASQTNITTVGTLTGLTITNNGNITLSGSSSQVSGANLVSATYVAGTLTTAAQPNITSVGPLSSLGVSGAVTASTLTSNVATGTAPLTVTSTTRVANLNVNYANVADYTAIATQSTGNYYLTFASAITGNVQQTGNATFVANLANGAITATTFVGTLSGAATTAGTVTTAAQPNITSVGTLTSLGVNGTVTAVNITANTGVFTGNANGLTSIPGGNVTGTVPSATNASALLQNTSSSTTVYPTFTTSSANGNSSAVFNTSISANLGNASITATTFVGSLSGAATSATTAGTVTTASQPNITSVSSSFTGLTFVANGNITMSGASSQLSGANLVSASYLTGTLTTAAQPNITSVGTLTSLGVNGTVTAVNITANTGVFTGNGNGLSSIVGANVTGTVTSATNASALLQNTSSSTTVYPTFTTSSANGNSSAVFNTSISANLGNASITATTFVGALSGAATTAGTVTTAAQPNITSVGTLSSLGVSGAVTASTLTSNVATGTAPLTVTSTTRVANLSVAYANVSDYGVVTTQNTGTYYPVFVSGNTTANYALASNSSISANLANGAIIATSFIGNVQGNIGGVLANGTSNVSIPTSGGNVNIVSAGNTTVVVTGTGANVSGTANVTGNIIGGGELNVSGNAVVGGNLYVNGTLTYLNVTDIAVEDPIIQLQTGANGAAPTSNSGKDVGTALNYYDTQARVAFMGWDVSNAEFSFGSQTSISSEVVTFTQLGNIRAGNAQLGNTATANYFTGTLTTAAQPNITSVGSLTGLTVSNATGVVNFITTANVSLGAVANLKVTGGSSGQYLQTDGAGNLSFATVSAGLSITDDTSTNSTYYPTLTTATTGTVSAANVSSSKLYYNPSTGQLSATDFNSLSDITFKSNVNPLVDGMAVVANIDPVSFNWVDNGRKAFGVIAQDIEQILPEIVSTSENGIKTVSYDQIIPFLVSAIKELYNEIQELKKK